MLRIIIAASALAVAGLVLAGLSAAALGSARAAAKWPSANKSAIGAFSARVGIACGVLLVAAGAAMGAWSVPMDDPLATSAIVGASVLVVAILVTWGSVAIAGRVELSALINSPTPTSGQPPVHVRPLPGQPSPPPEWKSDPQIAYGQPYPGVVSTAEPVPDAETAPTDTGSPSPVSPEILAGQASAAADVESHTTTPIVEGDPTRTVEDPIGPFVSPPPPDQDPVVPADAMPGWVYADRADELYLAVAATGGYRLMRLSEFSMEPVGVVDGPLELIGSIEMTVWPVDGGDEARDGDVVVDDSVPRGLIETETAEIDIAHRVVPEADGRGVADAAPPEATRDVDPSPGNVTTGPDVPVDAEPAAVADGVSSSGPGESVPGEEGRAAAEAPAADPASENADPVAGDVTSTPDDRDGTESADDADEPFASHSGVPDGSAPEEPSTAHPEDGAERPAEPNTEADRSPEPEPEPEPEPQPKPKPEAEPRPSS